MKRRLYALLLAVCMTVTAMPQMTLAANSNVGGYIDVPFDLPEVNIPDEEEFRRRRTRLFHRLMTVGRRLVR